MTGDVPDAAALNDGLARVAHRLVRHYEAIFIVATMEQASAGLPAALPLPDILVCLRAGKANIADVVPQLEVLRLTGANLMGVIVWNQDRFPGRARPARPDSRHASLRPTHAAARA
jgi:hypothetical protein